MPKFKEVVSLQTMAIDRFIESVIQCCNRLSKAQDRNLFQRGVVAIRTAVHRYLPGPLLAEFGNRFFQKFDLQSSDKLDYQVGLEMIMDIKIIGLRLKGKNLKYLDLRDGQRLPGLEELELVENWNRTHVGGEIYRYLPTYNTNFLTKFVHQRSCDDDGLAIIGQQCQNLEVLIITKCEDVTDKGLRALSPCSNLRCVHFRCCRNVSHLGLNHLLSTHKKLEDFYYEPNEDSEVLNFGCNIDVSSGLERSVTVPSLKSLIVCISRFVSRALNLSVIVGKFPNLINLEINCSDALNLSALKHMNQLTGLKIYFRDGIWDEKIQRTWEHIEEILAFIGPKITALTLWAFNEEFPCRQEQLNMIYNRCPNLEQLAFDNAGGILTVPEFKKLKALAPRSIYTSPDCSLNFGTMPSLENLWLPYSEATIDFKTVPEMIFGKKFPKLSLLRMHSWGIRTTSLSNRLRLPLISHSEEIERIVKDNNLDFRVVRLDEEPRVSDHFTYNWFEDRNLGAIIYDYSDSDD